jgi:hypothetical protein
VLYRLDNRPEGYGSEMKVELSNEGVEALVERGSSWKMRPGSLMSFSFGGNTRAMGG